MSVLIKQTADFHVLQFTQELTIFTVGTYMSEISELLGKEDQKVVLDLSEVEDFDTAGFQLIWWLALQFQAKGVAKVVGCENEVIQRLLDLYKFEFPENLDAVSA
jgi:anti-anti-sigma factor